MTIFRGLPLQRKITWVIMMTSLTTLAIAVGALFVLEIQEFKESMIRELNSVAAVIGANSEAALEFDDPKAGTQTLAALVEDSRIIQAVLYNADGMVFSVYESGEASDPPPVQSEISSMSNNGALEVFKPIMHDKKQVGTIYVRATDYEVYRRLARHATIAGLILAVCAIAAYFISARLRNVISRPILNLSETARLVSQHNDYSIRAKKESEDETGALVDQFNEMLEEIGKKNRAIEDTAHQLRLITDSLPVLIAYVDAEERYQFNNASYQQWFGFSPAQLKGMTVSELMGPVAYDYVRPYIQKALSGIPVSFEQRLPYKGAGERYVSVALIPDARDGVMCGYFGLITDISERKKFEDELRILNEALEQRVVERTRELEESQERLRQSERLASIGTLAAGVAHEIRNPLNSILLVAQYALRYKGDLDEKLKEMLNNISSEAKRCAAIIKNILLFAKAERTERSRHDLNDVVRHAVDLARSYLGTAKTTVNLALTPSTLPVMLNPTEIEQVLVNLINNASESSSEPVEIQVSTSADKESSVLILADNGPGIPEDIIQHIFDPFFSTKRNRGNTGLGLSLSHGIIVDHGGSMVVESIVGKGTTFKVTLPREHV